MNTSFNGFTKRGCAYGRGPHPSIRSSYLATLSFLATLSTYSLSTVAKIFPREDGRFPARETPCPRATVQSPVRELISARDPTSRNRRSPTIEHLRLDARMDTLVKRPIVHALIPCPRHSSTNRYDRSRLIAVIFDVPSR